VDRSAFSDRQQHHVRRAEGGYHAFLPPPLPPSVSLDAQLVRKLSDADRAIGELAGLGRSLPNPHLLSRALMRREAVLFSSRLSRRASLPTSARSTTTSERSTTSSTRIAAFR
jgi:Fic family protein